MFMLMLTFQTHAAFIFMIYLAAYLLCLSSVPSGDFSCFSAFTLTDLCHHITSFHFFFSWNVGMTGGGTLQVVYVFLRRLLKAPTPSHNASPLQMNRAIFLFYFCFFFFFPLKDSVPNVCPCPFIGIIMNILFFLSPPLLLLLL